MKTALQQLIDYLDPIHSEIKRKATELLDVEQDQLHEIYIKGINEGISMLKKELDEKYLVISKHTMAKLNGKDLPLL